MRKYIIGFFGIVIIAGIAIWLLYHRPTLIDLQRTYLFAKTEAEREKVIDQLEEYYLNLSIPDSIGQQVEEDVAALLDTVVLDLSTFVWTSLDTNHDYELEYQINDLFEMAMISRVRQKEMMFYELMDTARQMAVIIDKGTQTKYWLPFIEDKKGITREQALAWLKAKRAKSLCQIYHDSVQHWRVAELYGAFGLQSLQKIEDTRLKLDIVQRFQFILYEFYSFIDLSIALAERYLKVAESMHYQLRTNGIGFHIADALFRADYNERALKRIQKVITKAEKFHEVPYMTWYRKNGLATLADVYFNMGQYENSLAVCDKLEQLELTNLEKSSLHITKGRVNRNLSNYELAESEFKKALTITQSANLIQNEIIILEHLGVLFESLTEYDRALNYYYQSQMLTEKLDLENYDKIRLLLNIAEIMAETGRIDKFEEYAQKANNLIRLDNLPSRKANFLQTLGKLNIKLKNYQQAIDDLKQANLIYQQSGLLRKVTETNINIIECLIGLKKFAPAKALTAETNDLAVRLNEIERLIDTIAMQAEIEKELGLVKISIAESNRLIREVEKLSDRFENTDKLIFFRQKIYDYLKNSVVYEIYKNRLDSAFVKLDYAKARAFKHQNANSNGHSIEPSRSIMFINIDSVQSHLNDKSIIFNYMVMQDTLYAFVVDNHNLQLLKKEINQDVLRKEIYTYNALINQTIEIFNNYDQAVVEEHFSATTQLGQKLFQQLMGWPGLKTRIEDVEVIYIMPDEFLYELPFSTLVMDTTDSLSYLVHHAAVVNLPGASFFLKTKSTELSLLKSKKVLVSADPRFPEVNDFVSNVKNMFPLAEELTVQKLSFDKQDILYEMSKGYDIYMLLGHGLANNVRPELSFMELYVKSSQKSISRRVKVSIQDLNELSWSGTELVFLVGCETAGGKLYRGTGILGLQQGFLFLGAQSVLASLWKIPADYAIPQAQAVLKAWKSYSNLAMALRETKLKTIRKLQYDNYYKRPHPYFWGNYILTIQNN